MELLVDPDLMAISAHETRLVADANRAQALKASRADGGWGDVNLLNGCIEVMTIIMEVGYALPITMRA